MSGDCPARPTPRRWHDLSSLENRSQRSTAGRRNHGAVLEIGHDFVLVDDGLSEFSNGALEHLGCKKRLRSFAALPDIIPTIFTGTRIDHESLGDQSLDIVV